MIFTENKKFVDYEIWKKILQKQLSFSEVITTLKESNLQTRGGFNFISNLSSIEREHPGQKYVVCNAEEGEPGTFKDRDLLLNHPKELIEGIAITGLIIGATVGYIYIKWEFEEQLFKLKNAIKEAYKNNILGKNINNSDVSFDLYIFHGAGGYIAGEFTAILESIEGKKSFPRIKPPLPTTVGLYGCPTAVVNVETLASIPGILNNGAKWYMNLSKSPTGGCKIFSVSGHINKPGNYVIPIGTKFTDLLKIAGGMKNNRQLKAVLPGGISSPILPKEIILNLELDYSNLTTHGSTLGSAGIIIMDENTCMVEVLDRVTKFYMEESCGQCSPCREGTGWLYRIVNRIFLGKGTLKDLEMLDNVANNIFAKNMCALGDMAAASVKSFIKHFRQEFSNKIVLAL